MSRSKLLLGTINAAGRIDPRPVIVTTGPAGEVTSWAPLSGHEPHSTEVVRGLLRLPELTINPIERAENRASRP